MLKKIKLKNSLFLHVLIAVSFFVCLPSTRGWALEVLPERPVAPAENIQTKDKIELGRQLFFDKRLSQDNSISCNSCHNVMGNGADTSAFSKGVGGKLGGRNSPTVWNAAFHSVQFWDGRAALLEDQAKGPLINPVEMAMRDHAQVVERVASKPEYVEKIKKIYGEPVSIDNIAKSIAAFERTLLTPDSPFDQYMKGNKKALSASAVRGMKAVQSVGCTSCHSGPNFAGPMLPMGTGFYQKFPVMPNTIYDQKYGFSKDLGRFEVTKQESDKNMWRVPSWRNVARTAPYFHNGSVATLEEAVRVMAKTQLNRDLSDAEVKDMVAFLTSLNGKLPKITEPKLPM